MHPYCDDHMAHFSSWWLWLQVALRIALYIYFLDPFGAHSVFELTAAVLIISLVNCEFVKARITCLGKAVVQSEIISVKAKVLQLYPN